MWVWRVVNIEEALKRRKEIFDKRLEVRLKKAHDYAIDENIHRNFETMAKILKLLDIDITTPEGTCLFYIILKIDRVCNILFRKKGKTECEALLDTIAIDLHNYIDLLDEILMERGYYE